LETATVGSGDGSGGEVSGLVDVTVTTPREIWPPRETLLTLNGAVGPPVIAPPIMNRSVL